jgi:hypothetical protein
VGGEKDAIPQIQEMLRSLLSVDRPQDSPVLHAIPELAELGAVKEHEARVATLLRERDLLKAQLEVSEKTSLTNQAAIEGMREAIEQLSKGLSESQRKDAQLEIESAVRARRAAAPPIRVPRLGDVTVDPKMVFVLMPFDPDLDPLYQVIVDAACSTGLRILRADKLSESGSIIDQIFEAIARSSLIVADLTGRNQNVIYELGIAGAMGKETVLLAQVTKDVPFDIRSQRVLIYNLSMKSLQELRSRLKQSFEHYLKKVNA